MATKSEGNNQSGAISKWRRVRAERGVSKREAKRLVYGRVSAHRPSPAPVGLYRRLAVIKRRKRAT